MTYARHNIPRLRHYQGEVAPGSPSATGSEDRTAIVRRFFDSFNAGDLKALAAFVDPNVHIVPTGVFAKPGTTFHGTAGLESLMGDIATRFATLRFEPDSFREVNGLLVVRVAAFEPGQEDDRRAIAFMLGFDGDRVSHVHGFATELEAVAAAEREQPSGTILTPREREIFTLLARGLSGTDIADRLVLSRETVRTHIQNGIARIGAKTRVEAVVRALKRGEIEP